ncbi:MAG: hypothetical protein K2W96_26770 [Gemmataceae bacterium]|nr:hypothetical protein [Gemmataceae bacterium]
MRTIQTREWTRQDGTLSLCIPLGEPDTEFEVLVVVQPRERAAPALPASYFDLLGSVDDETLTTHPQPPLPPPVEMG